MRIALIGYGRMGRMVESAAEARGHEIVARIDASEDGPADLADRLASQRAQAAIDFSVAQAVLVNVEACLRAGVPLVIGTTGWADRLPEAEERTRTAGGALLHGANFSIGATLFARLVREAGRLFDRFPDYDPYVLEYHHRMKTDAPSGTAASLARVLLDTMERKEHLQEGNPAGRIAEDALQVSSVRAGHAFGTHEVGFDGEVDRIVLVHEARSRRGFAEGAVFAAEWIQGRTGVFSFEDALFGEEAHA
ncbi:MAG: 4-hydroxy-tetrahydrodipicolinate reductase [Gemmatimonadetes bacterium]|nr:4-hydroxy-tetrahydrodipicolinate reductase [Gemmatimonadota bacterium]